MSIKTCLKGFTLAAFAIGWSGAAWPDENLWVYARGVDTRPEGSWEIKFQDIIKYGKEDGDYISHEIRPSAEYGITNRFTVGAEFILFHHDYEVYSEDLQPYWDTQGGEGGSFNELSFGGYEFEFKYNILSPYLRDDGIGLSVGAGWEHRETYRLDGADIDQDTIVLYGYLQKNLLDDTLVFAFTPKVELEKRTSGSGEDFVLEEEIGFDFSVAVSYRFAPKWYAGLEYRHQSDYLVPQVIGEDGGLVYEEPHLKPTNIDLFFPEVGDQFQHGNYFGPTIHYGEEKWWATVGMLFQFAGGGREGSYNVGGKNYDEHEDIHFSLAVGFNF